MKVSARILFLILFSVTGVLAQTYQGRILGTVSDQSGAVIPGAAVTITNVATGVQRKLTTSASGEYVAANMEPGTYTVSVQSQGFETFQRLGLHLEVARDVRVDASMHPGTVATTLSITEQTPIINTTNDVLGSTFSNEAINELPLQGRDFQNLVTLQPGIQREPGGGFLTINANGNRATDNNFIVDGIDDNDAYYGETVLNEPGVTGSPATHLPIDAIQEFNVQSSPEADYGAKPGAIINMGIKSGTNQFHGSAYYFTRNNAIDARNYFNPIGTPFSTLHLHQFGVSAGGPIIKNKLFIFGNYEGVRSIVGNPVSVDTPVTSLLYNEDGSLDTEDSLASAVVACQMAETCDPMSMNLVNYNKNGQTLFLTNPGGTSDPNDITAINTDYNNQNREDNGILKLDFHATERNNFNFTYFIGDSNQIEEDVNVAQPLWLSHADTRAQLIGGSWSFASNSNFTNQFHFGYNRLWQQLFQGDHTVNATEYGLNTGVTNPLDFGMPEIRISGFMSHTLGGNVDYPLLTTPNQTYIFSDNASLLKGKHNIRFGGEFRTGSTDNTRDDYGPGEVRFSSLDDFVTGNASRGYAWIGDSRREVSQQTFGLYGQDSWHTTRNLTISYGLRYDVTFPIKEKHNLLGNFDSNVGLVQLGKQISTPYDTDWNNVSPRLAFVYDVGGNGRTVVRIGGGMIYEVPHISVFIGQSGAEAEGLGAIPTGAAGVAPGNGDIRATFIQLSGDTTTTNWQSGGPVFGNLDPAQLSCSYDAPCPVLGVNRNIVVPYVFNWNANVQQALWRNAALTVAYVGNKGTKLYSIRDVNQNNYADDTEGDEQSGRPYVNQFPFLSFVDMLGNGDSSIYQGLQVTLKQDMMHGLFFVAGYTWAHSIDYSSSNRGYTIQNSLNPAAERGNSDFDIQNRFTIAGTYALPGKPGFAQMMKGWRFNSIVTAQSGEPILVHDTYDDISYTGSFNDRWDLAGNPHNIHWLKSGSLPFFSDGTTNPACVAADPVGVDSGQLAYYGCYAGPGWVITPPEDGNFGNMGRNVVRGPDFVNFDASISKTFNFGSRMNLEIRGEVFNIFNHPNFAGVDGDVSDTSSFGSAQYTPDVFASNPVVGSGGSRHTQIGAKFTW